MRLSVLRVMGTLIQQVVPPGTEGTDHVGDQTLLYPNAKPWLFTHRCNGCRRSDRLELVKQEHGLIFSYCMEEQILFVAQDSVPTDVQSVRLSFSGVL